MAVVRELGAAADVAAIARALSGQHGLAVLHGDAVGALDPSDARFSFVACDPVETSSAWLPPSEGATFARSRGWAGFPAAPRWIGAIPYEATRSLERAAYSRLPDPRTKPHFLAPVWNRYDAVVRIDRATGHVAIEADDEIAATRLAERVRHAASHARFTLSPIAMDSQNDRDAAHADRIRDVLKAIANGDVYQVNLARELRFTWSGSPLEAFVALSRVSPAPYGFFLDAGDVAIAGSSPELALEIRGDRLRTGPIKGTRPRGADAEADRALAIDLDADEKERAELTMAIDLHRNDLARVAAIGSVRVLGAPRVFRGSVWSRASEIVARRAAGITDDAIVRAMIPCGSVTGAPKVRAMEIIAELETFRRGLYTGAIGYVGRDGGVVLAVAIRTLEIHRDGTARYGVGGGIVADSDPLREVDETKWKAEQLARLGDRDVPAAVHFGVKSRETWQHRDDSGSREGAS